MKLSWLCASLKRDYATRLRALGTSLDTESKQIVQQVLEEEQCIAEVVQANADNQKGW